jgi:hypothetical protein
MFIEAHAVEAIPSARLITFLKVCVDRAYSYLERDEKR